MKRKSLSIAVLAVLAACGGGGSDSPPASVNPPTNPGPAPAPASPAPAPSAPTPSAPAPATPAPVAPPPVSQTPAPVVPPVNPAPVPQPNQPPAPPPQPAEGTYIPGSVILKALLEYKSDGAKHEAWPTVELSQEYPDAVSVSYYDGGLYFAYDTYPVLYRPYWQQTNFPVSYMQWDVSYNTGDFTLAQNMQVYSGNENTVLWRPEGFTIKSDDKFILNQTFAEWKGVTGTDWFVQLQVQDYNGIGADPKLSTAAFNLCVHMLVPKVRRLSCTIHDRQTGQFRGVRVVEDSNGLGPVEWLPKR